MQQPHQKYRPGRSGDAAENPAVHQMFTVGLPADLAVISKTRRALTGRLGYSGRPSVAKLTARMSVRCVTLARMIAEARPSAFRRLRARQELQLAAALKRADPAMATGWWSLLALRGLLPAASPSPPACWSGRFSTSRASGWRWLWWASCSSCCRCSAPLHTALSANLGDRTAAWLYDELTDRLRGSAGHWAPGRSGAGR